MVSWSLERHCETLLKKFLLQLDYHETLNSPLAKHYMRDYFVDGTNRCLEGKRIIINLSGKLSETYKHRTSMFLYNVGAL